MAEINGLDERIADLKRCYQEAERLNLNYKAGELLADINYLEELRELRKKQESFITVLDEIKAEIDGLTYYWYEVHPRDVINDVFEIIDKHKAESEGGNDRE